MMAGNQHNDWGHSDVGGKKVADQGGVGFTGKEGDKGNASGVPAGEANRQSEDPGQDAGASNGQAWRADVPDQSGVGFTADDAAGTPGAGGQGGQNRQSGGASASSSGVYTNFQHANPESNVNPAGAAQNSHGSATGQLPGGVEGQYQASRNAQSGMGAAAAGGNPGTSQGGDDAASGDRIHGAGPDGGAPAGNGSRQG
jgi:hypothetical protein